MWYGGGLHLPLAWVGGVAGLLLPLMDGGGWLLLPFMGDTGGPWVGCVGGHVCCRWVVVMHHGHCLQVLLMGQGCQSLRVVVVGCYNLLLFVGDDGGWLLT